MTVILTIITIALGAISLGFVVYTLRGSSTISKANKDRLDAVDTFWILYKDTHTYKGNYRAPSMPSTDIKFINKSTATYDAYSASK